MANYISIKQAGPKWICAPVSEAEYQALENAGQLKDYYFKSEKSIAELATAGVFGLYDTKEAAANKVVAVDDQAEQVNGPPISIGPEEPVN